MPEQTDKQMDKWMEISISCTPVGAKKDQKLAVMGIFSYSGLPALGTYGLQIIGSYAHRDSIASRSHVACLGFGLGLGLGGLE